MTNQELNINKEELKEAIDNITSEKILLIAKIFFW